MNSSKYNGNISNSTSSDLQTFNENSDILPSFSKYSQTHNYYDNLQTYDIIQTPKTSQISEAIQTSDVLQFSENIQTSDIFQTPEVIKTSDNIQTFDVIKSLDLILQTRIHQTSLNKYGE